MRPAIRKAILFTTLFGIVGYLIVDSGDEPRPARSPPSVSTGRAPGTTGTGEPRNAGAEQGAGRYALPERAALGAPNAALFGPQSWQPPVRQSVAPVATPAAPRVPAMPYRYAGRLLHEGQLKVYLAKGDRIFPIRKGDTLDGAYRVQSIEDTRITLVYLPLGRTQSIPVKSALPLAAAPGDPAVTGKGSDAPPPAARRAAHAGSAKVLWEGPKRVKLGAQFSVALHVTSTEPVRSSPMQFKFDPSLLQSVAVKPGRFFGQGNDKFSYRVSPEGSIFIGAANRAHLRASDAEFLVLTFRPIKPAPVAELSIASLSLQGPSGRVIALEAPTVFRTAITR